MGYYASLQPANRAETLTLAEPFGSHDQFLYSREMLTV